MQPSNILLIQVDQMHAGYLSTLGHPAVSTPSIDALAQQGVLFTRAYCQNPVCTPSRISMLSGQYPTTTRQFSGTGICDSRMPWMPRTFHDAGYRTGAFGKFHVNCVGRTQWGMDVAAASMGEDHDLAQPFGYNYQQYCAEHGVPWPTDQMHCHNPFGPNQTPPTAASPEMPWMHQWSCCSDVPLEHSLETWTTNQCLFFLNEHATSHSNQPFFAWLTYDRPHWPSTLPPEWYAELNLERIPPVLPPTPEALASLPRWIVERFAKWTSCLNPSYGQDGLRFILATYARLIEGLDAEIGRVMKKLRELNLNDETIILFVADHGDLAGDGGMYDKVIPFASGVTRVPLIIRPAAEMSDSVGHQVDAPIELVDLFPTLCALTGVPTPERIEGDDLSASILHGKPLAQDRAVICDDLTQCTIRQNGWALFYDASSDAGCVLLDEDNSVESGAEWMNQYHDTNQQGRRIELKRCLLAYCLQRDFGPFSSIDVSRIENGLDPDNSTLSLHIANQETAAPLVFRAAAVLSDGEKRLLVPYYNAPMRFFRAQGHYLTHDTLLPWDGAAAEALIDAALRVCRNRVPAIAIRLAPVPFDPPVTLAETTELWQHALHCNTIQITEYSNN